MKTQHLTHHGRVVRKPINANPRLEVNRGFHRRSLNMVLEAGFELKVKKSLGKNRGAKIFWKNLYWLAIKLESKIALIRD